MSTKNDRQIHRDKFNNQIQELLQRKTKTKLFTEEKYKSLLEQLKMATKLSIDDTKLKKFNFIQIKHEEILIAANNDPKSNFVKQYVHDKQLFDILDKIHDDIGHGDKKKMFQEIQTKFANITQECINIYLSLCQQCCQLKSLKEHAEKSKKMNHPQQIVHWQLIIIDMTNNSDGKYQYILNYNNPMTNFCILKPLKNNSAKSISKKLASIIGLIGPPSILSSNYSKEFLHLVLLNLRSFFPNLNIKVKDNFNAISKSKSQLEMLLNELCKNYFESSNWSKWLTNIQLSLNNSIIGTKMKYSPFEAFFNRSSNFVSSMDIFSYTSEELQAFFNRNQVELPDKLSNDNIKSNDDEYNYILYDIFNDWKEKLKILNDPTK